MKTGATFGSVFLAALLVTAASPAWAGTVQSAVYGATRDGATVHVFTLTNNHGLRAQVLDYGGTICAVEAPGRDGKMANVILCQKDLKAIEATGPMSALTGRYANRLLHGFTLEGKHYDLAANPAGVTLHGGPPAYSRRVLQTVGTFQHASDAGVALRLVSPDGDQGFPGALTVDLTYTLTDNNDFRIEYKAIADKPTVVNLTNHTYYNLAGYGSVESQVMTVMADQVTPTDVNQVPTGEFTAVAGTALDFRNPKPIGRDLRSSEPQMLIGRGYDHNFVLDKGQTSQPGLAARAVDPASGRVLEILTTDPGVQLYTGNFLDGTNLGKNGCVYRMGDGFALEPQKFPDTPNQPQFGSARVDPGKPYHHVMIIRTSTTK